MHINPIRSVSLCFQWVAEGSWYPNVVSETGRMLFCFCLTKVQLFDARVHSNDARYMSHQIRNSLPNGMFAHSEGSSETARNIG